MQKLHGIHAIMGPKEAKTPFFGREKKAKKATNISGRQNHGVGEWQEKKTIPKKIVLSGEKPIKDLLNNFLNRRYIFCGSELFCN